MISDSVQGRLAVALIIGSDGLIHCSKDPELGAQITETQRVHSRLEKLKREQTVSGPDKSVGLACLTTTMRTERAHSRT